MLLTSVGCTPCIRVKHILSELQTEFPDIAIEEVDYTSNAGSKLAIENNIAYPPAVFLDGKLVAKGKILAEQIIAAIQDRSLEAWLEPGTEVTDEA
jgi:thiol-disulfide isomerase/thioredoxin